MKFTKLSLLLAATVCMYHAYAEEPASTPMKYPVKGLPSVIKFTYESADRSDTKDHIGLVGVDYLFQPWSWVYGGVGGFGAVAGDMGGFFALGVDVGLRHSLYHDFWFDAGYFAGGGGANHDGSDEHSGFMGRAHGGIAYELGSSLFGVEYSHINLPDNDISSNQWGVSITLPGEFTYGSPDFSGITTRFSNVTSDNNIGFYRSFFGINHETYHINGNASDSDQSYMRLMGVRAGVFTYGGEYFLFEGAGAYDAAENGYMDILFGWGYEGMVNPHLGLYGQVEVGAGGGGSADTGNGLMYKPSLGMEWFLSKTYSFNVSGGYFDAPDGDFKGPFAHAGINYHFLNGELADLVPVNIGSEDYTFEGWSMTVDNQWYLHPERTGNWEDETIELVAVSLAKSVGPYVNAIGRAASAYGGNAGSYATGELGVGVESRAWHCLHANADVLIGAAGGGAIDVGSGASYHPEVGLSVDVSQYASIAATVGQLNAFDGGLHATTINAGLKFRFSSLKQEY